MQKATTQWRRKLCRKRDLERSVISNKVYPACKKILKDLRAFLRIVFKMRFARSETQRPESIPLCVQQLLHELALPLAYTDAFQ